MKARTIVAAALAILALPAHAAEEFCGTGKPHPIDLQDEARMKDAMTTVDIRNAQGESHVAWDKELNRVYAALLEGLDKDSAARLKASQRAWLRFRDAEAEWLWSKAMYGSSGSAGAINVGGAGTALLRQRVCDLTLSLQARENGG